MKKRIKLKCHNCGLKIISEPINAITFVRKRFEKSGWWKECSYNHWYCPRCIEKFKHPVLRIKKISEV